MAFELIGALDECLVFVNGEFLPGSRAALPVWDHDLLYGDGVFEDIGTWLFC